MTGAAIDVARARSRALYAAAQDARSRGDSAKAYALLEELLPLLEQAGELHSRHVVLGQMGQLLAEAKSYVRAIEVWCQAIPLAEAQGDLQGASMLLDRVAALHADQGAWRRALQYWEQAIEIDTRLGHAHNRAATLSNMAAAVAQMGDKLKADRCWSEALDVFEASGATAPAIAIGKAMNQAASRTHDYGDPLGLHARVLRLAEAAGDVLAQVVALAGMARAAMQLRKYEEAVPHWERACVVAAALGDAATSAQLQDNLARCEAALRGETHSSHLPPPPRHYRTISEYAVSPDAGTFFLVGELLAALHARGMPLRGLKAGDIKISAAGIARLSPGVTLKAGTPFEPRAAALDLTAALDEYSDEQAAALLAGYARGGYEMLDRSQPGFTDTLLDHFGVPKPRMGAMRAVDVEALLEALRAEIYPFQGELTLVLHESGCGPVPVWKNAPEPAFLFVLALLLVGVDCRALWPRDAGGWPAFELLLPRPQHPTNTEADMARRLALVPPGLELAAALAQALRGMPRAEPLEFNDVLAWARHVLTNGPDAQAMELADTLIDVALFAAELLSRRADPASVSFAQKAVILLEYTARGHYSDEVRLLVITRALRAWPEIFPLPLDPWPTEHGNWLWQWNSLLLALRELANKSVEAQQRGQVGVLRSAALRGVCASRHALRVSYASAHSRDPEVATSSLLLLRVTIKNYANLLHAFVTSIRLEHETTGRSAWLPWIESSAAPPHLLRELEWIVALLEAASVEGFSLDVARPLMSAGAEFYAEENCGFVLAGGRSVDPMSN